MYQTFPKILGKCFCKRSDDIIIQLEGEPEKMQDRFLPHISEDCDLALSFGETLGDLLAEYEISQKILVFKLRAVGLEWTDNKVSRLINNELPNNLRAQEVRKIAEALDCDTTQLAKLIVAYSCHKLREWGVL